MAPRRPGQTYQRVRKNGATSYGPQKTKTIDASALRNTEATSQHEKAEATRVAHEIDEAMGFARYESGRSRDGWLCNMQSTSVEDESIIGGRAAVDFYFIEEDGGTFKATVEYDPYFLVAIKRGKDTMVEEWCRRNFEGLVKTVKKVEKDDLQMPNHLVGYKRTLLQLSFANVNDLLAVRKAITPIAEKNKKNMDAMDTYAEVACASAGFDTFDDEMDVKRANTSSDASEYIVDIREYDVPYHVRVAIDKDIRIGKWYTVTAKHGVTSLKCLEERLQRADPVVMAFDIETTKLPLKFPDAAVDQIMMISYMIDAQGFLITNRDIVSEDISDFDYTPKPEYEGPFMIFNEPDEKAVLERFFEHIKEARPTVMVTYNGDFFDWPFVETRASILGIDMYMEIGFRKSSDDIYQSNYCAHMDAFAWVNRDSYLPQGSRGLKAVTVAKLGYDPDELDPELMTPYASERPQTLAEYSVSDAVATYYLYMKYVHPFIFSLCTIIPLGPDAVLRKGTGTLCEMLLMVQAYQKNIVLPNKHQAPKEAFWEGHLLESETYVGGHVESIEAGVFRSDIPCDFSLKSEAFDELIRDLDAALKFSITVEEKKNLEDVTNYDEVKAEIAQMLTELKNNPHRSENPSIYHLDVASMYPNIMTTNRLQPDSMINESDCAACDFNRPGKTCDRRLPWAWRGEFLPAKRDEYNMIRHSLESETFPVKGKSGLTKSFQDLGSDEQATLVKKRLTEYSKKIYHKIHDAKTIEREAIICQRENPFYVDTVKDFRDRRYDFKGKQKVWKGKTEALKASGASSVEVEEAKKMIVLFDSLQLAHKVILNSFYGYVMRKGSRWYSMEMAGVTCLTGAKIIQMARQLVERIGRPLELDTDGIWCILPASFPENFSFKLKNGKKIFISYPCVMLNHLVHAKFTNHQYQELVDPATFKYETHSDNTIFFEVDGPYRAMILPTSKEEDKNLKKRYAVFNHDGSLAELKGFEVKRRGELKLIKIFQTQIFKFFLEGSTLEETYASVATVADKWLNVLYSQGRTLADEELIDLICENKSMTKTLEEYGSQKSTAITTAKRLAEFLGEQMVKDKGLNCKYIISSKPRGAPVTERAIPVAIFSAELEVKKAFLRRWLREEPGDMDPRSIIDWSYYMERLGSVIQKLVTIPAALQKVRNPVPRVAHPEWLNRRTRIMDDVLKQSKMTDMFSKRMLAEADVNVVNNRTVDLEDFGVGEASKVKKAKVGVSTKMAQKRKAESVAPVVTDPYAALPPKMPSPLDDYQGFLRYQKQKWKIQKQARIRRRQLFGEKRIDTGNSIGNLFRNQAELTFLNTWHVLQLQDTDTPGEVKAFVLIDKKVHTLKFVVARQLFLNLRSADLPDVSIDGCKVEKIVNHTLPNGHPSVHLFKMTMPEQVYVDDAKKIGMLLNHPSVEGVYEMQIPLNTRAMLDLGSMCHLDESQKGVLGEGLDRGFQLSMMKSAPPRELYLHEAPLEFLFLDHASTGDRQIFSLFSTSSDHGHVVMLHQTRDGEGLPNLDRLYREQLEKKNSDAGDEDWQTCFEYQKELHFKTTQVTTRRKAYLELGDVVRKVKSEETRPLVLVLRSQQAHMLPHHIPSLKDFPTLRLPSTEQYNHIPSLGWQNFVARRIVSNYIGLGEIMSHHLDLARYGNIPLCNLESDDYRFLIDVAYARRLQKERVVLWWSRGPRPDHASHEADDILSSLDNVEMPAVNNPGVFSSVCVDIDIHNLSLNTIMSSSLVNDAEGSESFSFNPAAPSEDEPSDGASVIYSDDAFATAGMNVLRQMVKDWSVATDQGSVMADLMMGHLVRWVDNPGSYLYDRSLRYYVQMMSRKTLQQLMSHFRRVGSHIVFASPHRLLLQTTKAEVGNAYAYSQYVLNTVSQKPIFRFLALEIREYWDYLAWYDEFNYGGKGCAEVSGEDDQPLETIMEWQMDTFLPAHLQSFFHDWVVEFIDLMHARKRPPPNADGSTPRPTQINFKPLTIDPTEADMTQVLPKTFTRRLQKQVSHLLKRQQTERLLPELAADHDFPVLPGSHLVSYTSATSDNPVLQLVKSLMQVLSLDRSISLEARALRRDLLALFEVREFSDEAAFTNPSASLRVPGGLTCEECATTRELDLCRDPEVLPHPQTSASAESQDQQQQLPAWRCKTCRSPFEKRAVEEKLIAEVQRRILKWITQDVKCGKCGRIRSNDFMEHCACAGEWKPSLKKESMMSWLRVAGRVASYHGLHMLETMVREVGDL